MGKRYRCIMYLHLFTDICITYQGVDAEDGSVRGEHVMGLVKDFNKVAMSVLKDAERDGRLELAREMEVVLGMAPVRLGSSGW